MSQSYRVRSIGCNGQESVTLYYHNASAAVAFSTFTNSICAIYAPTPDNTNFTFYVPGSPFGILTSFVPGSSYVVYSYNQMNIVQQGVYTSPATFRLRPSYNFVAMDGNSLPTNLNDLSPADKAKIGVVYTLSALDCSAVPPYSWRTWVPGVAFGDPIMYPLSAYYIYASGDLTLNVLRANQYIITQNYDYITTESGDRFVTGVSG